MFSQCVESRHIPTAEKGQNARLPILHGRLRKRGAERVLDIEISPGLNKAANDLPLFQPRSHHHRRAFNNQSMLAASASHGCCTSRIGTLLEEVLDKLT